MSKLELNIAKIDSELKRIGKRKLWLADQLGVSSAMVTYIFKHKPISYADTIALVFKLDPKDMIRSNNNA